MKSIHLICNAHLDLVWLWEKEEGIAEAISTFRVAAEFCEQYEGFIFNHNEAILYEWVEEYEPELFERIKTLVKNGKWHIMGGWYLQPDCNMPCGESIMRQISLGRRYFKEKFNKAPTTATNFDPFGHSRGIVQILKVNGFDSYIFCRPSQEDCPLESDLFCWVGYDGSEIKAFRSFKGYCTARGSAAARVSDYAVNGMKNDIGLVLWGVGNHGGGPSRVDLKSINALSLNDCEIIHSTPESFFKRFDISQLNRHAEDLNPWAIGCYTSQIRIKQLHRELENQLFMTETMALHAHLCCGMEYPEKELNCALKDLMFNQFHDILPGTSIKPAEDSALCELSHGLETVRRIRTKAFFKLCNGQEKAGENEIPIFVYNPHPFDADAVIECEYQLPDQGKDQSIVTSADVYLNGVLIASQLEKEQSNLPFDWRKKIVFNAKLSASGITRFDCRLKKIAAPLNRSSELFVKSVDAEIVIDEKTGLLSRYTVDGNCLLHNSFLPVVYKTDEDPWVMHSRSFKEKIGNFTLAGFPRVIEDGDVRKVIESVFEYNHSRVVIQYKIPKKGAKLEIGVTALWEEPSAILKLEIPTAIKNGSYHGETVFGFPRLAQNGDEVVSQRFVAYKNNSLGVTIFNNGTYGSHCTDSTVSLTLLRSACYSAHPFQDREYVPKDRYMPHIDIGERYFTFNVAPYSSSLFQQADILSQKPYALSFFTSGEGVKADSLYSIDDSTVQISACFMQDNKAILHLFETTGTAREVNVNFNALSVSKKIYLKGYEIKIISFDI